MNELILWRTISCILIITMFIAFFREGKKTEKRPDGPVPDIINEPNPDEDIVQINREVFARALELCVKNRENLQYIQEDCKYPYYQLKDRQIRIFPQFGTWNYRLQIGDTTISYLSMEQQALFKVFIAGLEKVRMEKARQAYKAKFDTMLTSLKADQ